MRWSSVGGLNPSAGLRFFDHAGGEELADAPCEPSSGDAFWSDDTDRAIGSTPRRASRCRRGRTRSLRASKAAFTLLRAMHIGRRPFLVGSSLFYACGGKVPQEVSPEQRPS